jgi:hypothetical protein
MDLRELEDHVSIMLGQLRVSFRKFNLIRGISTQFIIEDFGLVVCCINRSDYTQVNDAIVKKIMIFIKKLPFIKKLLNYKKLIYKAMIIFSFLINIENKTSV